MRHHAPARERLDREVFGRPPLAPWHASHAELLDGPQWPPVSELNARLRGAAGVRFLAQTPALLADGLHYEQRIAQCAVVATREANWHDLFNALVWARYPALKRALNARQMADIARWGPRRRSRAQCALTHFDEAGVILLVRDPALLARLDAHDWQGLFWRERAAWQDGRLQVEVFGHALLEHALTPALHLVGKALVVLDATAEPARAAAACAQAIAAGRALQDPQDLRPLPLSGIPGWHADNAREAFYRQAPCFRPLRPGRRYPPPIRL